VVAEWKVGDVILDIYEVKHIHDCGGMGRADDLGTTQLKQDELFPIYRHHLALGSQ